MAFKILCSDLDGTLLTTKSDVSEFTIAQIAVIKKHLKIILVSARMPQVMTYLQERLGILRQPIICYNGALVLDGERELFSETISFTILEKVYALAKEKKIHLGLYYKEEWYVAETSERIEKEIKYTRTTPTFKPTVKTIADWKSRNISAHKIMLMGTKKTADSIFTILKEHFTDTLNCYRSNDTLIEVAPKNVSKYAAIQILLNADETMADVISFGDNYNDIEMIANSGMGVAVANAREEVKAIAQYTTLKNTEDGVAHFIKQQLI